MSNVLEFTLSASYGKTEVLHQVTASVGAGEILAAVGLTGSGKSTLALALLRLLQYRGGTVTGSIKVEGRELTSLSEREMRGVRGRLMGYVPQSPGTSLNERLRVRTLLQETWAAHAEGEGTFPELLDSVQLPATPDFLNQRAGELSTGMGQRLLIALAIMHKPPVLLADEPTSALDVITQAAILKLFAELNQKFGTSMLFISHDLLSVASISHRVDILHEGRIVESGPPARIFGEPRHVFTRALVAAMPRIISSQP